MSSVARIAFGSVASKASFNVRAAVPVMAVRSISGTSAMQKDVVQDLFLKELKGYKPTPVKVDESQVKELKLPPAPEAPKVDEDLSAQLAAYDAEPEEATQ
ncbi:hypothetical protein VTP01DRAFT_10530 [Rhizomucor pusillus]|uniref:uncharacterized protein n=1 Tax=Rhizomucor pusillus TaxID=4840 RepID=UPI0037440F0C